MQKVVSPVFMPIVEVSTGIVSHYEALARTKGTSSGHVRLIEMGEEYGFVFLIDLAILEHCFKLLTQHAGLVIAVNVSVRTIEESCSEALGLIFQNMHLVDRVIFEVTETTEIQNARQVMLFAEAVRLLGGRIAIDDFGAGHFTVALIEKLRPEFLKLDGKMIADLEGNGDVIVQLCELVAGHGGRVIAEHVDSKEKMANLRSLGVHYAQGYFVGEPRPFELARAADAGRVLLVSNAG